MIEALISNFPMAEQAPVARPNEQPVRGSWGPFSEMMSEAAQGSTYGTDLRVDTDRNKFQRHEDRPPQDAIGQGRGPHNRL